LSIEREIKLALPMSEHGEIAKDLTQRTGQEGRKVQLTNVYFDTPDHALAKAKSAVRLRGTPDQWLQTYKTAGESAGGLHNRHEWERPVAGEALEIPALLEIRTDFSRVIWDVEIDGAKIEAALDLGEVVADVDGERLTTPISELELELKSGNEEALNSLAAQMRGAFLYLQPEDASKARRGYDLCAPKLAGSNGGVK
jgi:inorganic triphosphatase YgiF